MRTTGIAACVLLLVVAGPVLPAAGTPESGTTTVLIPTYYEGPGAHGSFWWSFVFVYNHSPLPVVSPGVEFAVQFDPIPEAIPYPEVPPGKVGYVITPRAADGLLLHIPAEAAEDLGLRATFGQGEDDFGDGGMELPLVREHRFTRKPVRLPGVELHFTPVPIRTTLRIYGIDALPGTTVRIETGFPTQRLSKVVTLHAPPSPAGLARPLYPAYAQLDLQTEFPAEILASGGAYISIVPLPLPSGEIPRIWAFITSTDNVRNITSIQQPQ